MDPTSNRSNLPNRVATKAVETMALALVLGFAFAAALSAQSLGDRSPVVLSGQVIDQKSGQVIQGVVIQVQPSGREAISDKLGRFQIRLRPGDYLVSGSLIGYEDLQRAVSVAPVSQEPLVLQMEPQPEVLAGITVTVDQMDRRRFMIPVSSRVWERDRLRTVGNLDQFLRAGAMITRVACPSNGFAFATGAHDCVYRRGRAVVPAVYIDDFPVNGGFDQLAMYSPSDVNRLEIYGGGVMIRLYTDHFVESVASGKRRLSPVLW